jgi:hypothetical protein
MQVSQNNGRFAQKFFPFENKTSEILTSSGAKDPICGAERQRTSNPLRLRTSCSRVSADAVEAARDASRENAPLQEQQSVVEG